MRKGRERRKGGRGRRIEGEGKKEVESEEKEDRGGRRKGRITDLQLKAKQTLAITQEPHNIAHPTRHTLQTDHFTC